MRINTFIDKYNRTYSVRAWTFQHLFCIFLYFVIFALPFYFSFASKNFWFDEQYAKMLVNYYYTGYYAVQINYLNSGVTQTSQFAIIPSTTMNNLNQLTLSVFDNSTNAVFTFQLNGLSQQIISTNILIYYDVEIPTLKKVASASYAVSVPADFQSISVSSILNLQVNQPFNALTSNTGSTINRPAYFDVNYRSPNSYSDLFDAHLDNNYKLESQSYIQLNSIPSTNSPKTLTLNFLKNTQMVIPYYPSILETFKLKFSTYFGMLMLSYLIFKNLLLSLIKNQALQCNQQDEVPKKTATLPNY